jgi:hypothetical protein
MEAAAKTAEGLTLCQFVGEGFLQLSVYTRVREAPAFVCVCVCVCGRARESVGVEGGARRPERKARKVRQTSSSLCGKQMPAQDGCLEGRGSAAIEVGRVQALVSRPKPKNRERVSARVCDWGNVTWTGLES